VDVQGVSARLQFFLLLTVWCHFTAAVGVVPCNSPVNLANRKQHVWAVCGLPGQSLAGFGWQLPSWARFSRNWRHLHGAMSSPMLPMPGDKGWKRSAGSMPRTWSATALHCGMLALKIQWGSSAGCDPCTSRRTSCRERLRALIRRDQNFFQKRQVLVAVGAAWRRVSPERNARPCRSGKSFSCGEF